MNRLLKQIENYIQLHTSDTSNEDYVELLRGLAEWATSQADIAEFQLDNDVVFPTDE